MIAVCAELLKYMYVKKKRAPELCLRSSAEKMAETKKQRGNNGWNIGNLPGQLKPE